jgi:hypothetical protein
MRMSSGSDVSVIAPEDLRIVGVVGTVDIYTASPQRVGYLTMLDGNQLSYYLNVPQTVDNASFDQLISPVLNNVYIPLDWTWRKGDKLTLASPNNNLFAFIFLLPEVPAEP